MIKIDDKALNYAKSNSLCFVAGISTKTISCDWHNGGTTLVKSLRLRVLYETEILDKEQYNIYEYQGIKIYILDQLKVVGDIHIFQKMKLPFSSPAFAVTGIKV